MRRLRRLLPALALAACVSVLLGLAASAATPRELADEYCRHTNAMWCVDKDGDGTRESAPQLHPRFTEEGIEHLRERGRYYDPNDVVESDPAPTATPTPTPTPTSVPGSPPSGQPTLSISNLDETAAGPYLLVGKSSGDSLRHAVGFITGGRSGGYTLASIRAPFAAQTNSPGAITVAVHPASNNNPGTAQVTLAGPTNPSTAETHTWTCPANGNCALSENTTYFLVMSAPTTTGDDDHYRWGSTTSGFETTVPSGNGWSIENDSRSERGSGGWSLIAGSGKLEVLAY